MRVLHHLQQSLIEDLQLVIVLNAWWELHAIGYVIQLLSVNRVISRLLGHIAVGVAVVDLCDLIAIGGPINDPELSDLVHAVRTSVNSKGNV